MKLFSLILTAAAVFGVAHGAAEPSLTTVAAGAESAQSAAIDPCFNCHARYARCVRKCPAGDTQCGIDCKCMMCRDVWCHNMCEYNDCCEFTSFEAKVAQRENSLDASATTEKLDDVAPAGQDESHVGVARRQKDEPASSCPECTHNMIDCRKECDSKFGGKYCELKCRGQFCADEFCHKNCDHNKRCEKTPTLSLAARAQPSARLTTTKTTASSSAASTGPGIDCSACTTKYYNCAKACGWEKVCVVGCYCKMCKDAECNPKCGYTQCVYDSSSKDLRPHGPPFLCAP